LGTPRAIAALGRRWAPHSSLPPAGEGANTGPSAAMARVAVWFPAVQGPCVRAEERSARDGWGCRRTPPTSTSDLPQLFERSAQREVSSAARPAREHHRLPRAQHGDTDSRAGVLWWLSVAQKVTALPGAYPGTRPMPRSANVSKPRS